MSNYLDNTCKNVKYYYTFKECVCDMWNDFTLHPDEGATVKGWYQNLRQVSRDIDQHGNPPWIENMSVPVKELCLNYIKPIMYNKNVYFYTTDKEYTVTNQLDWKNGLGTEQDMIQRVITFIQKIYTTKDKYEKLIELQKENIASIIKTLVKKNIDVYEVKMEELTLEEAFLKKTGGKKNDKVNKKWNI